MNNMPPLIFEVDKMFRLPDAGTLKAFCDVSINGRMIIKGVRLMEGKSGLFIGVPQEQGKDNRWYDQVVFTDIKAFDAIAKVVIDHYKKKEV